MGHVDFELVQHTSRSSTKQEQTPGLLPTQQPLARHADGHYVRDSLASVQHVCLKQIVLLARVGLTGIVSERHKARQLLTWMVKPLEICQSLAVQVVELGGDVVPQQLAHNLMRLLSSHGQCRTIGACWSTQLQIDQLVQPCHAMTSRHFRTQATLMVQVFELGGDVVPQQLAHNLMRLVAEGAGEEDEGADAELRSQAVQSYLELLAKPRLPSILLKVSFGSEGSLRPCDQDFTGPSRT